MKTKIDDQNVTEIITNQKATKVHVFSYSNRENKKSVKFFTLSLASYLRSEDYERS
jgi:hypothetical protein